MPKQRSNEDAVRRLSEEIARLEEEDRAAYKALIPEVKRALAATVEKQKIAEWSRLSRPVIWELSKELQQAYDPSKLQELGKRREAMFRAKRARQAERAELLRQLRSEGYSKQALADMAGMRIRSLDRHLEG